MSWKMIVDRLEEIREKRLTGQVGILGVLEMVALHVSICLGRSGSYCRVGGLPKCLDYLEGELNDAWIGLDLGLNEGLLD